MLSPAQIPGARENPTRHLTCRPTSNLPHTLVQDSLSELAFVWIYRWPCEAGVWGIRSSNNTQDWGHIFHKFRLLLCLHSCKIPTCVNLVKWNYWTTGTPKCSKLGSTIFADGADQHGILFISLCPSRLLSQGIYPTLPVHIHVQHLYVDTNYCLTFRAILSIK